MKNNSSFESIVPISRRNVLKAGAVTAVGVGLFTGTAAATNPRQINFCGCSQVCLASQEGKGGFYKVIYATEDGDGWSTWEGDRIPGADGFCREVPDEDTKIVAVRPRSKEIPKLEDGTWEVYCNPGTCARNVLASSDFTSKYTCVNDDWGTFDDIKDDESDVLIVHGQCGRAGRTPNPGPNPRGPN